MIARDADTLDIPDRGPVSEMLHNSESLKGILDPALVKYEDKSYSLEPDMVNGWRPRRKVYRQIPLRYLYQPVDLITKQYTKPDARRNFRIIYLGPRHNSNLKLTRAYHCKQYETSCKEAPLYEVPKLKKFSFSYGREKDKTLSNQINEDRLFTGMNPTLENDGLVFDSDFECGNLDLVMKITPVEFDLFMRVDTNTRGHNSWFFFKVRNTRARQPVKFNICNFHRTTSLFTSGMRPSVFSRLSGRGWTHEGTNTTYTRKALRYPVNQSKELWCLSFDYTFEIDYDEVYFAYSVPYSYSYLLHFLDQLSNQAGARQCMKISNHFESPGGLIIPLLTISNPTVTSANGQTKKIVLVTGRQHPGQTQGSWTMQGLITFLCSNEAKHLRNSIIFKIIPMVNVDGVVAGNFRTGLLGLDLNRLFRVDASEKYYEVEYIKELASIYKNQILMYLDFHGHSTKKNIFIYGPDYKLVDSHYLLARVLPKTISKLTETFRYYSCIFKVSREKEKTARAVMLREYSIPYCYTIEASAYCYTKLSSEVPFTSSMFIDAGIKIGRSVQRFVDLLAKIEVKRESIIKQKKEAKETKQLRIHMYKEIQLVKVKKVNNSRSKKKIVEHRQSKSLNPIFKGMTELEELFDEIKKDEKLMDVPSQGDDSDCQNEEDDYPSNEHDKLIKSKKSSKKNKVQVLTSILKKKPIDNNYLAISELKEVEEITPRNQQLVIIRDLGEEERISNKHLIYSRANYMTDESLPEIKSSRPKRVYDSLQSQRLYSRISRDKAGNWASNGIRDPSRDHLASHVNRLKMQTLDSRKAKQVEEYDQKIIVRQGCVVNLKIESEEQDRVEEESSRRFPSTFEPISRKFPDLTFSLKKEEPSINKRRKLQIIELKPEIPDIISQILKKHLNSPAAQQRRNMPKSIQIVRP